MQIIAHVKKLLFLNNNNTNKLQSSESQETIIYQVIMSALASSLIILFHVLLSLHLYLHTTKQRVMQFYIIRLLTKYCMGIQKVVRFAIGQIRHSPGFSVHALPLVNFYFCKCPEKARLRSCQSGGRLTRGQLYSKERSLMGTNQWQSCMKHRQL